MEWELIAQYFLRKIGTALIVLLLLEIVDRFKFRKVNTIELFQNNGLALAIFLGAAVLSIAIA